ncbi:hypothetical protein A0H81_06114 [Grifola frondosa]|uniref:DUF676 domain-containing protein n=1 Tax=Grifola frondosa TaxID=5627 RepID=A0A1C7MAV2_GRIFR|nr:hypothetical protein A0H81_06114 [Grifola frondosa]
MISSLFAFLGPKLLSRTGEQFYVVDKWSANGRPLLEVMADPERIFFQALTLFPHIRIYANAVNDMTVPYPTAAIEYDDIFANHTINGMQIIFTGQWFKNLKPNRPLLPPALQFGFPYNVLIMLVTPVLIPLLITLILSRLSMASIASRKRIKKLETDESSSERLAHILGKLERGMEDAMVELLDSQGSPDPEAVPVSDGEPQIGETPKQESELSSSSTEFPQATEPLVLNDTQRKIITLLNTLPNLRKELAFIHPVRNAHATIISRDIKRFPSHKIGEGVLRHWADHFII